MSIHITNHPFGPAIQEYWKLSAVPNEYAVPFQFHKEEDYESA